MFILARQRDTDPNDSFRKYREYLTNNKSKFPPGAYRLASSDWWFAFTDHNCPHDAWLERLEIIENSNGSRKEKRSSDILVTLLGAYQDRILSIRYTRFIALNFECVDIAAGHGDWRYDQFRLSESGNLIHEIEWANSEESASWFIEAQDVAFTSTSTEDAA